MSYTAQFSFHAAQRMQERFNIKVPTDTYVSLDKNFAVVDTFMHSYHQVLVDIVVHRDLNRKFLFLVSQHDRRILTVYLDKYEPRTQKWFDSMYDKYIKLYKRKH